MASKQLELHVLKGCPFCEPSMFIVDIARLDVKIIVHGKKATLKTPEYLALNPRGEVPVLVTPEGPITESVAIMNYLARLSPETKLLGSTNFENAIIDAYVQKSGELRGAMLVPFLRMLGLREPNIEADKLEKEKVIALLK